MVWFGRDLQDHLKIKDHSPGAAGSLLSCLQKAEKLRAAAGQHFWSDWGGGERAEPFDLTEHCLLQPNRDGLLELVFGGFFYCLGMVFFKSDGRIPFAHAIWHLFVAIGAGIHYYAIWRYLYRPGALDTDTSR